jgi:hypothetical protein
MKFRDFLVEKAEKHAAMTFMRANPITSGHQLVINKVKDVAREVGGSHHIVLSHTQDAKKNPLSAAQKIKHAKRAFPGTNFSASSRESPNFLTQAADLHKRGVTHLHVVGGSDRVKEFHDTLHRYNGTHKGALFNFKKITVHSAGERDPDAEGVSGMSASKMRDHAQSGNFNEFKKGTPSSMSHAHAKELYNDVRKGMGVNEDINHDFEELLTEGVHDKAIFKAVFLAGGPGSGKDYVLSNTLDGHGLVEINSDKALEFLMDKEGLDKRMPEDEKEARDFVRGRAKNITELKQRLALTGRNGLIINGTGDDVEKIERIKNALDGLGYESSMILVNTSDEISAARNIERGQRGGRTVPETIRKQKWDAVQNGRTEFAKMFGDGYMEFDNSEDLREADPDTVKAKKMELLQLYKNIQQFVARPPQSEQAQEWIANEMQQVDRSPKPDDGVEKTPPSDSQASAEARKLGLKYYGFGRYGKDGKVTHRSVNDKLVDVSKMQDNQSDSDMEGRTSHKIGDEIIHVKRNKKKIDEEFEELFEAVGQGGRDYEDVVNTRLKKYGKARPDATTAGSSADAPDASFLHKNKEHNLEIKADKGAMFGQMELHHNGTEWDASEKSKKKYPETYKAVKKSGFFKTLNSKWKKPSGKYETDLKMGNVYHEHPNADPIKSHYGKDRETNYIQIGKGHGFYHTGNDVAKLGSPELHGKTQIRARMKPRGYDAKGNRTYGALAVMSLKGDVKKSHHDLDKDPINEDLRNWFSKTHPRGDWVRMSSTGEIKGPCAREPGEPKPKCLARDRAHSLSKKERAAAVRAKRRADPDAERTGKPINVRVPADVKKESINESYDLSDSGALNILLLGNSIDEHDLPIGEEKEAKLLKDKTGRVRIFMLRAAAAREAHTHDGKVLKYKNGYVIQLKENENDEISKRTVWNWIEETRESSTRRFSTSTPGKSAGLLTEGVTELIPGTEYAKGTGIEATPTGTQETGTRPKITFDQIRQRKKILQKENECINEIDKGIEPGLSMATAGENASRIPSKNKAVKKPFEEAIGAGGEMATSMSDYNENDLKRKGINLQSFKAKRPIG